ncbi:YopX family protein [Psychrobacillus psychrotolerans]|uniref:YopX family protein n=1 Tax=Psychrobacillus psychrotolerans TaxID=126156 RepID=UPI003B02639E
MREIKFRAWDYNNEKVIPWENIRFEKEENEVNFSVVVFDDSVGDHYDDFPIMQYTGLTDRNGVEIYEGDILKLRSGQITEVFYQSGCYMVSKLTTISLHGNKKANLNQFLCNESIDSVVIGNVHESPELLEVEANA